MVRKTLYLYYNNYLINYITVLTFNSIEARKAFVDGFIVGTKIAYEVDKDKVY